MNLNLQNGSPVIVNDCDCDHYKVIINLNGLSINMITVQESILLDLIDSKKMSREV